MINMFIEFKFPLRKLSTLFYNRCDHRNSTLFNYMAVKTVFKENLEKKKF